LEGQRYAFSIEVFLLREGWDPMIFRIANDEELVHIGGIGAGVSVVA
jgi:hypothetical protein